MVRPIYSVQTAAVHVTFVGEVVKNKNGLVNPERTPTRIM